LWEGAESGVQFFTGYILEKSLSVDNSFLLAVIFGSLAICLHLDWVMSNDPDERLPVSRPCGSCFGNDEATSPPAHNNGNGSVASSGFNQLRNQFSMAEPCDATTKNQAIGEGVECASGGAFKYATSAV
jgi:hypothetical protein